MDFKQLIELLGENSEAVEFVQKVQTDTTKNIETINSLERSVEDIKSTRDDYKKGNSLVKSLLGLEQINEDTVKEFINKKGKGGDETLLAEIDNLKNIVSQANSEKESVAKEYESKIYNMTLDNEISNSGISAMFSNDAMAKIGMGLIREGATLEDGAIVYKNEDGTTAYNGSNPMGIKDKFETLKSDASYAGLFKPDVVAQGGGVPPNQNPAQTAAPQTMNATEMMKAGRK